MSCIINIDRFIIPNDIITTLTSIYKFIGKNKSFENIVETDLEKIVVQTIERDCYFIAKILELDITDSRMRLIVTKNSNPRTIDETILYRIKEVLSAWHIDHNQATKSNDLINITNYINPHANIKYAYHEIDKKAYLQSQSMRSKRILLDEINDKVSFIKEKQTIEPIVLYLHFFIDFYNLKPFTESNKVTAYLLLYLLLLKAEVHSYKYVSFYEQLYKDFDKFEIELKNASFNWSEGFAQTLEFLRYMTKFIYQSYIKTEELIKAYQFDQNINKSDNIENTISKLPNIFTKEEIRNEHPLVSESTINRTLSKLKEESAIKPLGKGRSAKWVKL